MPKARLDLEAFEKLCDDVLKPVDPIARYSGPIREKVAEMRAEIAKRDKARDGVRSRLGGFTTIQNFEVQFVMTHVIDEILSAHAVRDDYLSGEGVIDLPAGWRVVLRRPDGVGLFEVQVVTAEIPERHDRQSLHYTAVAA